MRNSLKNHIKTYLATRYPDSVIGSVIEELSVGYGFKGSNGSRRARELAKEGVIEAEYYRGSRGERLVKYRFKMPQEESKIRQVLKETGRIKIEIVEINGQRIAKEVYVQA